MKIKEHKIKGINEKEDKRLDIILEEVEKEVRPLKGFIYIGGKAEIDRGKGKDRETEESEREQGK